MSILYVFPHPDDESFGPALAIARQRRAEKGVHLLTLTRGGATKQRHRLGLSIEEMGEVRLALFTLAESDQDDNFVPLKTSPPEDIDCAVGVTREDVEVAERALDCYETYREVIEKADPLGRTGTTVYFELFGESHDPRLGSLTEGL
jgi:hypothetical protein